MEELLPNGSGICRNPESCDQPFAEQQDKGGQSEGYDCHDHSAGPENLLCPLRLSRADILRHDRRNPGTEIDDRQEDYGIDPVGRGDRRHRLFTEAVHELLEIDIPHGAHAGLNCRRQPVGLRSSTRFYPADSLKTRI